MSSTEPLVGAAAAAEPALLSAENSRASDGITTLALGKRLLLSIVGKELHIHGSP
jgi:hypothetical protein